MTTPRMIETDADLDAWYEGADEPSYLVYSEGMPWIAYQTEDCDWYATRPAHEDDRREDGTYPGGVTLPLGSLRLPMLIEQSAEMPPATPSAPAVSVVGAGPRTITTRAELDALPWGAVVARTIFGEPGEDWHKRRDGMWLGTGGDVWAADLLAVASDHAHMALTLVAPVVPVVSDAAVEAAARALFARAVADTLFPERTWDEGTEPYDDEERDDYRAQARDALSAAFPILGAAPSATREDVDLTAVIGNVWDDGNGAGLDGWTGPGRGAGEVDHEAVHRRERAVRRALDAITPRTDR